MTRPPLSLAVAAAGVLALALVASPLTLCVVIATPLCLARFGRGLPDDERRVLIALLGLAMVVRAALVAAQMIKGLPLLNDMSVGALAGDESYYLSRALRVRDMLFGFAATKYDFFVANDDYGQTSYVTFMTWLQVAFGPTPYSLKLFNGLIFVCGAALLFRMARASFGTLPAFAGLIVLLFLPSLLFSSVSLLKESAYFFTTAMFATSAWYAIRLIKGQQLGRAIPPLVLVIVSLLLLDGLRRGGLVLMGSGLLVGVALFVATRSSAHRLAAAIAVTLAVATVTLVPALHERFINGIESAAKVHGGHVFTIGHVYKLMDDDLYVSPKAPAAWDLQLTDAQAIRFLGRAAMSFVVTPWPWQMRSTGELALLPEHVVWYLLMLLLPIGIVAGFRIDPFATSLFLGLAIPTAAVVALTNGNVGTLFRLRGLVTPYLLWIGAVGLCAVAERMAAPRQQRAFALSERPAL